LPCGAGLAEARIGHAGAVDAPLIHKTRLEAGRQAATVLGIAVFTGRTGHHVAGIRDAYEIVAVEIVLAVLAGPAYLRTGAAAIVDAQAVMEAVTDLIGAAVATGAVVDAYIAPSAGKTRGATWIADGRGVAVPVVFTNEATGTGEGATAASPDAQAPPAFIVRRAECSIVERAVTIVVDAIAHLGGRADLSITNHLAAAADRLARPAGEGKALLVATSLANPWIVLHQVLHFIDEAVAIVVDPIAYLGRRHPWTGLQPRFPQEGTQCPHPLPDLGPGLGQGLAQGESNEKSRDETEPAMLYYHLRASLIVSRSGRPCGPHCIRSLLDIRQSSNKFLFPGTRRETSVGSERAHGHRPDRAESPVLVLLPVGLRLTCSQAARLLLKAAGKGLA
jgi:hypothetical protein